MSSENLVSIVTAVRNGEKYLERTIQSVLCQTHGKTELIVIDGGSKDATLDIIRKYENRISYWISEPDNGMYDAINKGIKKANGAYLAYLNSDDVYNPDTVAAALEVFKANSDTSMIYGDCDFIDGEDKFLYRYRYPDFDWNKFVALNWMSIPQPTVFWKREIHEKCGYLDPSYKMVGDFEFFSRVGKEFKIMHVRKPLARFRIHGESLSAKGAETNRQEVKRMRESLGLEMGMWQNLARFSRELEIKAMNFPLMAKKLMGIIG